MLGKAGLRARFVHVRTGWRGEYQPGVAQDPPGGTVVLVDSVVTLGLPGRGHG